MLENRIKKIGPLKLSKFDHANDIDKTVRNWYLNEKGDKMENATIELIFNGKKIKKECLGNLNLKNGIIEMKIIRKQQQDDETTRR